MDTTFIKMCGFEEIQELNPCNFTTAFGKPLSFEQGNWYSHGKSLYVAEYDYYVVGSIWLPTQAQLQKMVFGDFDNPIYVIEQFTAFHKKWQWLDFTSMEQLWLAFVMKEKWNKVWVNEEWLSSPIREVKNN